MHRVVRYLTRTETSDSLPVSGSRIGLNERDGCGGDKGGGFRRKAIEPSVVVGTQVVARHIPAFRIALKSCVRRAWSKTSPRAGSAASALSSKSCCSCFVAWPERTHKPSHPIKRCATRTIVWNASAAIGLQSSRCFTFLKSSGLILEPLKVMEMTVSRALYLSSSCSVSEAGRS